MGFLLPSGPNIKTEGPRLQSKNVTDSAYGNSIPIAFATVRLGGNVIWATEIEEKKIKDEQDVGGKGGGGGTQTTITYLYYVSFAIAFAEGPAADILRIWADGKLIFDQKNGSGLSTKDGVNFRFYQGTEDQLQDPLIVQDKGYNAPANRGLCYVVFERFPLQDFGNRIPSITAEINFENRQSENITTESVTLSETIDGGSLAVDYSRDRVYVQNSSNTAVVAISLSTMQIVQQLIDFTLNNVSRKSGKLFGSISTNDVIVNPFSGAIELSVSRSGGGAEPAIAGGACSALITDVGTFEVLVSTDTSGGIPEFRFHNSSDLSYLGKIEAPDSSYEHISVSEGPVGTGTLYAGFFNEDEALIYKIQVKVGIGLFGSLTPEVEASTIKTVVPTDLDIAETTFATGNVSVSAFDEASFAVMFGLEVGSGSRYLIKVSYDGLLEWATQVPFFRNNSTASNDNRITGGTYAYHNGTSIVKVNVASGELDPELDGTGSYPSLGAVGSFYDDNRNAIYNFSGSATSAQLRRHIIGGRDGASVPVADIIESLSERVGLSAVADIDVTQLTQELDGYVIDQRSTVKAALQPLARLFLFDLVERDGKLVYQERGQEPVDSIQEDYFVKTTSERPEQYEEKREQEAELPYRFTVNFIDAANDFQTNTASAKRLLSPFPTVKSDNTEEVDIPAVIDPSKAKQTAEALLYSRWLERSSYEARLPWTYLYLDPSDVCTFTLNNGYSFRGRLDSFDIGADLSTEVSIVKESTGQYVSTLSGDSGSGVITPSVPIIGQTQLFLLDTPLLVDSADTNGNGSRAFWAASNYGEGPWPGARLFQSQDGTAWSQVGQQTNDVAWGVTQSVLPDPGSSAWRIDRETQLTVNMVSGLDQLESVTELQMLNGENAALLIKTNGEVEIIQFQNVTAMGNNQYVFDTLLRGRRGTDAMAKNHSANEYFIVLDSSVVEGFLMSLAQLNSTLRYKPVTVGQIFENAVADTFNFTGRDLMPYAPVHYSAVANGADIDISWVRRTRLQGGLRDGTGTVPLAELTELYDLEILDSPGGSVVRTVSNLTSPTYKYLSSEISSDGMGSETELTVRAYQKSDQIGRGFTVETTTEIL